MISEHSPVPQQSDTPLWDKTQPLKRFAGNEKLLNRLVDLFIETHPSALEKLKMAIQKGDLETVRTTAHAIKGNSADIGVLQLHKIAMELEYACKDESLDDIAKRVLNLDQCSAMTIERLSSRAASG